LNNTNKDNKRIDVDKINDFDYVASPPVLGPSGKILATGKVEYGLPSFVDKNGLEKDK
jgi:hypothetical protein